MDIRMPDGTIIKGVPDNLSQSEVLSKLKGAGYDTDALLQAPTMGGGEVLSSAVRNIPSSTMRLTREMLSPVTSPVQTAKGAFDLVAGTLRAGVQKILPEPVFSAIESLGGRAGTERAERVTSAVGADLARKYGSLEGFKKEIASHPMGVASDLAGLLTFGGGLAAKALAKGGAAAGQAARVAPTVSALEKVAAGASKYDPSNLLIKAGVGAPAMALGAGLGLSTGVGRTPLQEAYRAGQAPLGTASREFLKNISGSRDPKVVVEQASEALRAKRDADFQNYLANTNQMRGDTTALSTADVTKAINEAKKSFSDPKTGYVFDEAAQNIWRDVAQKYQGWASNPNITGVASDFDLLKRSIGSLYDKKDLTGRERSVVNDVYSAIRKTIEKQNPQYSSAMKKSEEAINELNSIRRELSLGKKEKADTALKRLQSVMRNNVNTGWGNRLKMADELQKYAAPGVDLRASLAGQTLSSLEPRGLARLAASIGGLSVLPFAAGLLGPAGTAAAALGSLAASSPKIVGYGAYGAGAISPLADLARQARQPALQFERSAEEERKRRNLEELRRINRQ